MRLYQQERRSVRSVPIPEPDKTLHNNSKDRILSYPIPSIVALDFMCSYAADGTVVQLYRSQTVSRSVMSLSTNPHLKILHTLGIKMTSPSLKSTDKNPPLKFP